MDEHPTNATTDQSDPGLEAMLDGFWPYRRSTRAYRRLDEAPRDRADILAEITELARTEDAAGDKGLVSGSLYSGDHEHYAFLTEVFGRFAHANVLQRDMYPSATKFEAEIIAMTAAMLHGDSAPEVCGVITSGGSESLMTVLLSYREYAQETRGVTRPNVVLPVTAHVALDKGAHYFGIEVRHAPLTGAFTVDVAAMAELIDDQTIALVASAADYGHGLIDPVEEVAALARERELPLHIDGCLGGFLLPWAEKLGYDVPVWDFRVSGVTSMSADTHKYGYGLKGSSVLLYANKELRRQQYFTFPDWPGGLYLSPGLAGSRSGGLIASTWAAMVTIGEAGYLQAAQEILRTAAVLKDGIRTRIPELQIIGDPLFVVSFASDEVDVYLVNDALKARGWRFNALQLPAALHFCVTRPNTAAGLVERLIDDLRTSVDYALEHKGEPAASGAMYGFGHTPQGNATLSTVMSGVLDAMHEVAPG